MPVNIKLSSSVFFGCLFIFLFFFPSFCFAQVFINEFNSYGSSDWVEIYRTSSENLSLYFLEDETGNEKQLSWDNCNGKFCTVDWDNKLNNSGDIIKLFLVSNPSPVDQIAYGDKGNDSTAPQIGQSAGRSTDGARDWIIFSVSSKGSENGTGTPASPESSSFSPNPSPANPTPSPQTTYKINEVKDEAGNILNNVEIYIDEVYVHHYAPETITFCDGCQCDTYTNCGFGEHTIKLEKTGYQTWTEGKTISTGNNYEVNPVMSVLTSTSPSPVVSLKPSPVVKLTPSKAPSVNEATNSQERNLSGEILGAEESPEASQKPKELSENQTSSGLLSKLPFFLIPLGAILVLLANFKGIKPKLQAFLDLLKNKDKSVP